jgi:nitroreductase
MDGMANSSVSNTSIASPHPQHLTPNEKALLDKVGNPVLRTIVIDIWRVKLRLQFTGWLQYIPPSLLTVGLFIVAAFASLLGVPMAADAFLVLGCLLLASSMFDLMTVRFRLRFPERLPTRNDDLGMFDLMRARRSCRSFQTRKLTANDLDELMSCVQRRGGEAKLGESPVRFEYVSAPLTVWPTVNASEFLVAIAPRKYNRLAVIDVGRSLQKIVIDATRMGLGTCWIGPGADQSSVAGHLGDRFNPEQDHIICVCAIGYKSMYLPMFLRVFNRQLHWRLPLSSLFFSDTDFQHPLNIDAYPFNRFGRTYEVCQWSPSSYNGQTTRCVAVTRPEEHRERAESPEDKQRLVRFDFIATTESRYYAPVAVGIWCADWEMGCEALGIDGHLAVLPDEQRGVRDNETGHHVPHYDVSWLLDGKL